MGADCGCQNVTTYGGYDNGQRVFWIILIILLFIIAFQNHC